MENKHIEDKKIGFIGHFPSYTQAQLANIAINNGARDIRPVWSFPISDLDFVVVGKHPSLPGMVLVNAHSIPIKTLRGFFNLLANDPEGHIRILVHNFYKSFLFFAGTHIKESHILRNENHSEGEILEAMLDILQGVLALPIAQLRTVPIVSEKYTYKETESIFRFEIKELLDQLISIQL